MSREININRQLLGLEDLLFGVGIVTQTRAGKSVNITRINASNLPFDETQTLLEWAQNTNLAELGAMIVELQALYNSIDALNNLEDNLVALNTLAQAINCLNNLCANLTKLQNIDNNMTKLQNIDTDMTKLQNIDTNMTKLQNIDTNMLQLSSVYTNMDSLQNIYTNMSSLLDINSQIIPHLSEILLVDDIAQSVVNYQGDWTSRGYTLGQSVSVSGVFYICKLTHATGQNPTNSGSIYWNIALGNWNLKVDKSEAVDFMRKTADNTITKNIIFNNGTTDTNGLSFVSNNNNDINVDMYNGILRLFRNSGLVPLSISANNNLYADNGINGNGRILTSTTPLGYSTSALGVGGTVAQGSWKTDSVTLNKLTGLISTANSALAAGASATFTLNNNQVEANDGFYITPYNGYIDPYNYKIETISTFNGGAKIKITNISAGSLSDIVQFKFQVIKGVIS